MRNILSGDLRRASLILVFGVFASAACGSSDEREQHPPGVAELDPCGGPDHPCSLAGSTPEAMARTDGLARHVFERLTEGTDADLTRTAAWLEAQPDVVSVATGPEAIRFRVRGGAGHWIFVQTAGTILTLGGSALPLPGGGSMAALHLPAGATPAAAEPLPVLQTPAATDRQRKRKKALLLSPFRWQWEVLGKADGIDEVARVLRARDYRPEDVTVVADRLDPANPACQSNDRWQKCQVIREIQPSHFTSWTGYDYVHLLTHGGAVSVDKHTLTSVMTPWTVAAVEVARPRYSGEDIELINRIGTEGGWIFMEVPDQSYIPTAGPGQIVSQGVPTEYLTKPAGPNPDLSPGEQTQCEEALGRQPDVKRREAGNPLARTVSGKPCVIYPRRLMTGKFVLLTSRFFYETYEKGIDDAVILMSACSSAFAPQLLGALKGRNTVVLGWKDTVSIDAAAAAGTLIAKAMVEAEQPFKADSGVTVGQAVERIRRMLDEVQSDKPSEATCNAPPDATVEARCLIAYGTHTLTVVNDAPADGVTGASLVLVGDSDVRAREVVYLVGPGNEELADGGSLAVFGAAGDGKADMVDLKIRVDGLSLEDEPRGVRLAVDIEGRTIAVGAPLEKEVGKGIWELDYRLPLGRDHVEGEVVDLEIVAELPGGKESRWLYEDIRLGGTYWRLTIGGGPRAGTYSGSRVNTRNAYVWLPNRPAEELRQWGFGLTGMTFHTDQENEWAVMIDVNIARPAPGAGIHRPGDYGVGMGQAAIALEIDRLARGDFDHDPNYRSHRSYAPGDGVDHGDGRPLPPPATLTIESIDYDWVTGTLDGTFFTLRADGSMFDQVPVRLEFRARRCMVVSRDGCVAVPDSLR